MKVWHPSHMQGWFPKWRPDGWMFHGAGDAWLSHPERGIEHHLGPGWHIGWYKGEAIWFDGSGGIFSTKVPEFTTTRHAEWDFLINSFGYVSNGSFAAVQAGGYMPGHWGAILTTGNRVFYDTVEITHRVQAVYPSGWLPAFPHVAGEFLGLCDNPNTQVLVFEPGGRGFLHAVPIYGCYSAMGPRGEVVYVSNGKVVCVALDGKTTDETILSWGGDGPGQLIDIDGVIWRWFWTWHTRLPELEGGGANTGTPGGGRMIGHPLGSKQCVSLPAVMTYQDVMYADGKLYLAGTTDKGYGTVLILDKNELVLGPPPELTPIPPAIVKSFTLDPMAGVAPLDIRGHIETENVVAGGVRWVLDEVINKPDDMTDHVYKAVPAGDHDLYVRTVNVEGKRVDSEHRLVKVLVAPPPKPRPVPFNGLNGWMPGDGGLAAALLGLRWQLFRGDLMPFLGHPETVEAQVREMWSWGGEVLAIVTPGQVKTCPQTLNAEVLDCDRMSDGKPPFPEPNLRHVDPVAYAKTVNAVLPAAYERGIRIWAGASNMDAYGWWKAFAANLDPSVGLTPHRYPRDARRVENPQVGATDRGDEIEKWFAAIGGEGKRDFIVSEFGYHTGLCMKWSGDLWKLLAKIPFLRKWLTYRLTDEQVAAFVKWEFAYWKRHGATAAILYQLNDAEPGVGAEGNTPFGIRRYSTNPFDWKPVAFTFK